MKGLELSEKYYNEYGRRMFDDFPGLEGKISVGLVGSGSECFGFDDSVSRDHDFEPGFTVFIPDESVVDRKTAFALERAYSKLPSEFMGYKRSPDGPVGGQRKGIIRLGDFLLEKTGRSDGVLSPDDYFFVPEYSLAEAVNGKLFRDDGGAFGCIRERISDVPRDVLLKKIAGNLFEMHQSGVYNFKRCISHGEAGASVLAINRFVTSTVAVIFNINRRFCPYYKWQFRALRELSVLGDLSDVLEYIVTSGSTEKDVELKSSVVDSVSDVIVNKLRDEGFCDAVGGGLIDAAYSVNKKITDPVIRNRSIMYAVH